METAKERILLIESDPQISRLIAEQTLQPLGYHIDVVESASAVIQNFGQMAPDIILTDLNLPGLSGKDLLIFLVSCGINVPIIVIANKGQETDILQAFRLGADDYILNPIRETEVISVIEKWLARQRVLDRQVHEAQQAEQGKSITEQQKRDFSAIFSISKLLLSSKDQQMLFEKIVNTAMLVAEADSAWIITVGPKQNKLFLQTCQNAPDDMRSKINQPIDDDMSALAIVSGQAIAVHGEALKRFTYPDSIESALVVPVKHNSKVSATITVTKQIPEPFTAGQQSMLELLAGYAAIILENYHRYRLMERGLLFMQQSNIYAAIESDLKYDLLAQASFELRTPIKNLLENVHALLHRSDQKFNREQTIALNDIQEEAEILLDIADSMVRSRQGETSRFLVDTDLNEVVRSVVSRFLPIAQMGQISITSELPSRPTIVRVYPSQITKVIEGLLSNALKFSPPKGLVTIHIDNKEEETIVKVNDQGEAIDERLGEGIFDKKSSLFGYTARRFGGLGISLPMIKEIIAAYKGRIWTENNQERGFTIAFSLPKA